MFLILNNGGQYVHRIWRSLKYLGEESEIIPNDTPVKEILARNLVGLILSGGPCSVYGGVGKLGSSMDVLESGIPVLGICLGHQIIAQKMGGKVQKGESAEYAQVEVRILERDDLFQGLSEKIQVWESHKDEVSEIPEEFIALAESDICRFEAVKHNKLPIYGVQFHPEVEHTPDGPLILKNYVNACSKD